MSCVGNAGISGCLNRVDGSSCPSTHVRPRVVKPFVTHKKTAIVATIVYDAASLSLFFHIIASCSLVSESLMVRHLRFCIAVSIAGLLPNATVCFGQREALFETLAKREEQAWNAALQIWNWAEPGYQEEKSSALLANQLEGAGFRIERKVAGIPTAFTATFGSGRPVIGILGEFDALPGLSQEAVPYRQARDETK